MQWKPFHHPDISLPVIRRRTCDELVTLMAGMTELLLSRGMSTLYKSCYPSSRAFDASTARLEKAGLITRSKSNVDLPEIHLTDAARKALPAYFHPQKHWDARWNQWWYVLMFDVPEKNRAYRDTLRAFLKQRRLGCLQKSVWVTPVDIRPDYDDLNRAAGVDSVAFLFESRTVLGFGDQSVVTEAWDFKSINRLQEYYILFAGENLKQLNQAAVAESGILQLIRMDNLAYAQAMSNDPLLPKELHPSDYVGMQAAEAHHALLSAAVHRLQTF
jgi:phenylacetic acid degradation operon negative regulatory protein